MRCIGISLDYPCAARKVNDRIRLKTLTNLTAYIRFLAYEESFSGKERQEGSHEADVPSKNLVRFRGAFHVPVLGLLLAFACLGCHSDRVGRRRRTENRDQAGHRQ